MRGLFLSLAIAREISYEVPMQTISLKNKSISEDLTTIENTLKKYGYESIEIERYSLLTEEVLLKWKEALGEEAEAFFETKETRTAVKFVFTVKGKKVYPFEHKDDSVDFLSKMHDRLLEGTGCEFRYAHLGNKNRLSLTLPKKKHEEKLFYKNMVYLAVPVAMQWLLTTIITATDSILMGLVDQNSLSAISMTSALMDLFNILITALVTGTTIFAS